MGLKEETNLILRVTDYAIRNNSFPLTQLFSDLELDKNDKDFIENILISKSSRTTDNPNQILVVCGKAMAQAKRNETDELVVSDSMNLYRLLPNAFYNYVDYLEIKEARKQADEAKRQANTALKLTIFAIIISILLGLGQIYFQIVQMIFR